MTIEYIDSLWNKFSEYKERAEQHEFVAIAMLDMKLVPLYNDLHNNWDEHHAEIFARYMKEKVFSHFGIKED